MNRTTSKYWLGDRIRFNRSEQEYGSYVDEGEKQDIIIEVRFVEDSEAENNTRIDYICVEACGHIEEQYVLGEVI